MFRDKVAQNPTMPVNAGKKNAKKEGLSLNFEGCSRIGPRPLPASMAQNNKANAASGRKTALNTINFLMLSTPRYTTYMFNNQKRKNMIAGPVSKPKESGKTCGKVSSEGIHRRNIWYKAKPPIQVCIPNQPQATMARRIAGILAPLVPKLALAKTGNGIPYLAPA